MTTTSRVAASVLLATLTLLLAPFVLAQSTSANVIVIGAGIAGIKAAKEIKAAGRSVIILEARGRTGGRIITNYTLAPGIGIDLGASWIHGASSKNPIYNEVVAAGLPMKLTDWDDYTLYTTSGARMGDAAETRMWDDYLDFEDKLVSDQNEYWASRTRSVQKSIDEHVAATGLTGERLKNLRWQINSMIEQEYAADAKNMVINFDEDYDMPGEEMLLPQGFTGLVNKLTPGLDIRLNTVVTKVVYRSGSVTVVTNKGNFTARAAVVTLPLGVLKSGAVTFVPAISLKDSGKAAAINRLGLGVYNKAIGVWDTATWDHTDIIQRVPLLANNGQWSECLNMNKATGKPSIVCFASGEFAQSLESLSDGEVKAQFLAALRSMYGDAKIPEPKAFHFTRWSSDPYARMSYSYCQVGSQNSDYTLMGRSMLSTLFWAGEHTIARYPSTLHGAYISGSTAGRAAAAVFRKK